MSNELAGQSIGFIGLGLMGKPMCRHLLAAGADITVYNRTPSRAEPLLAQGARLASSPGQVAAQTPLMIVMVSDSAAVAHCFRGVDGIIAGIRPDTLVIDMGTTSVDLTRELADELAARGGEMLDAPVSGGQLGADQATLTIMAGGSSTALKRAEPVFRVLGKSTTHMGGPSAGQVAKAANQIIVGLTIAAVAEALQLARKAGVDPALVQKALTGGFADSPILQVHGKRMIEGSFQPGGKVRTQHKDLQQALDLAAQSGVELPVTSLVRDLYARLMEAGDGDLDHSALIRLLDSTRTH